ncbi:hypothetical protein PHYBLDRAFT_183194 [Phycomyces blakesleeanus NRRL 1555(-)]|uniref:ubiquitinyl hydrolase 1 n=1 Tax=Phycomyces blakesleeanus (strain ATCC 8743b / DSM 1359 / FGSC 10004 / NBRC 33097 / NRRL 1555) TaxID=763407 RepID=A0A162N3P2_PHYB8|nr:hypothetical protein PHYBLDRAFT_183194 [Phycomyces blakesleeanus NRRL 1555(-)]OAD68228.1 hypothetical protein PHYBLDRAFT_183194 [Phycomyces blakesleeanus NRRL 1555(-)]|eukprot:XP_018286268.1 hypothetical protein PHYBLDRAFT_183194 [Phycomyces blakesleeanus NRRL 1555(-)]
MSDGPPIPPRAKLVVGDLLPPDAFTPAALLEWLLHYTTTSNHQHNFTLLYNPEVDLHSKTYVCMTCHYGIELLAETPRFCTANQYQTHHYHYKTDHYQCCGCSYTIQATFNPPLVSLDLLGRLAATRPNYQTLADRISQPDKILPTLETTFTAALQFTKDLIKGSRRDINSRNVNLEIKLGVDPASIELLNLLGFELKDSFFIAPSEAYVTVNKDRLLRIQHELALFLESCRSPTNNTALDISSANPLIAEWVGVNEILEPTTGRQVETFRLFGTIPTAKDDLVIWLYQMVLKEHPNDSAMYLDCLIDAANLSRSNLLLTEVALERSRGKVGYKEIREACENFDIKQDVAVDDRLLTELYRIKVSDEPHNKNKHRDHLKVIAIARRSEALYDFLKDEVPDMPKLIHQDGTATQDWNTNSEEIPVGLNNIGNTCYFNSLLQYYFTLLPLRKTVLNIDSYVENEDDPNWVPKKIGGITVDQHEVRRAKKFVYLLRSLFINLQNTSQRAISPEYDLAYMALLNEKDVEEAAAEAAAEAVASVSASAVEASSTPIESLQTIDQQNVAGPSNSQHSPPLVDLSDPRTDSSFPNTDMSPQEENTTTTTGTGSKQNLGPLFKAKKDVDNFEPAAKVEVTSAAKFEDITGRDNNAEQTTKSIPVSEANVFNSIPKHTIAADALEAPRTKPAFSDTRSVTTTSLVKIDEDTISGSMSHIEQVVNKDQPVPVGVPYPEAEPADNTAPALVPDSALAPNQGSGTKPFQSSDSLNESQILSQPNRVGVDTLLEGYTEPGLEATPMDVIDEAYPIEKIDTSLPEFDMPPAYEDLVGTPAPQNNKVPPPITAKRPPPNPATMMFGKQQDVTECMDNVTYLIEAALKPVETQDGEQVRDMVRDLFYGKARQILTYQDTQTSQNIKKIKEEEFSHLIVDAAQGKDLYDGLDEYFFADQVENFQGGREATREVTVSTFPPVLQIIVQRVQFDRATANVYKSNAFIQFEKIIYLDRYADRNFDSLAEKRAEVTNWRKEEEIHKAKIDELINNKANMLEATANILEIQMAQQPQNAEQHEAAIQFLLKEAREARETIQESTCAIEVLRSKIKNQYSSLTKDAYRIHAVFIHQGQANYGHYWVYMYDKPTDQWWKYNDSHVTKVEEAELFRDTSGSTANPYFLVYVREEDSDALVETVAKKEIPHVLSAA